MDIVVLRRLVAELAPRLRGQYVRQVYALPRYDLAFVLSERGGARLWFSADPQAPHLYLRTGTHESPERPPAFAMAARKWARGQRIEALELIDDDRVVSLSFRSGARVIMELVPRRACAFVVDPDGTVAATWNPRRGRPAPGDDWVSPSRSGRAPIHEIAERDWEMLDTADGERALVAGLMRTIAGMSHLVAREVVARRCEDLSLGELVRQELDRAVSAPTDAGIYGPTAPAEMRSDPGPRRFLLAPYPLQQAADLDRHPETDLTAAATTFFDTRARLRRIAAVQDALQGRIRSRLVTLERSQRKIEENRSAPGDAEELRRAGDLLLAAPRAEVARDRATVPDVYGDGSPIEVAVDPSRSLTDNAEAYYRRARRAERRVARQAERLAELGKEVDLLRRLATDTADLHRIEDCERLLARAGRAGLEVRADRTRVPAASSSGNRTAPRTGSRRSPPVEDGIRRFRTRSGAEILVGRSAKGNDRLTHRTAAREDWWLHARGPGSHVVLRNPQREDSPQEEDLLTAAALAAWFSKARGSTKCEVHWTRVRDLKRPRGAAPGKVLIERHQTLLVAPESPDRLGLETVGRVS